jgi:hypothetical protein
MAGEYGTPRRIGAVGFSVREQLLLRSLVHIAGSHPPGAWEFVEGPPYHALFASPDAGHAIASPDVFCFTVPVPLKSDRIALLLETLKRELPRLAAAAIATDASTPASLVPPVQPERLDDAAAIVRRLMDRTQPRFGWMDGDRLLVTIDQASRTWRVPAAAGAPVVRGVAARLARGAVRYVDLSANRGDDDDGLQQRLESLLWHVGLVISPNGVLPQVRGTGPLRLSRWPDFGTVGSDTLQLKLSALLITRAYSVDDLLLAGGGVPARQVAFLNACALCELFVRKPGDDRPRALSAPRQFGPVMRMVRSALGMVQG